MSNADNKIRRLMESVLAQWAEDRCPPVPVAYQNVKFSPPANEPYVRAYILRGRTTAPDLAGDMRTRIGIFQVNILTPDHIGPVLAEEIASEIEDLFPPNLRLDDGEGLVVQIIEPASLGPAMSSEGRYMQPVSFTYRNDLLIAT